MNVMIPEDLRKRAEHARIERGDSLGDLVADALEAYLAIALVHPEETLRAEGLEGK